MWPISIGLVASAVRGCRDGGPGPVVQKWFSPSQINGKESPYIGGL